MNPAIGHLDYSIADKHGLVPDKDLIRRKYKHTGNDRVYTVIGFAWNGDSDEWQVLHEGSDTAVKFTRSLTDFFGMRNGRPRFIQV